MIIWIKRYYLNSGEVHEIGINTRYILRIESTGYELEKPRTRILYERLGNTHEGPEIIYTNQSLASIKVIITKEINKWNLKSP